MTRMVCIAFCVHSPAIIHNACPAPRGCCLLPIALLRGYWLGKLHKSVRCFIGVNVCVGAEIRPKKRSDLVFQDEIALRSVRDRVLFERAFRCEQQLILVDFSIQVQRAVQGGGIPPLRGRSPSPLRFFVTSQSRGQARVDA